MDHILGQQRAIEMLQSALCAERLHHAFVFHGPAGVGKFTTAVAVAHLLLCHDRQPGLAGGITACGACQACRLLRGQGNTHPDLHIVTKELARYSDDRTVRERKLTSIPVDVLRTALIGPVYRAAHLRHNKLFIIDEAELLNPTGQNLLLKTLEEPPIGTYLILVTSREEKLLATVRSRCHRVAFSPLPDDVVSDWISHRDESLTDPDQRRWLVTFAAGSFGRAQLAADYNLCDWAQLVLPALDAMPQGRYPVDLGAQMAKCIDTFAVQWTKQHENASKDAANRAAAGLMWSILTTHAQTRITEVAQTVDPADASGSEAALDPYVGMIDAVTTAERALDSNVNLGLICDHLVSLVYRALSGTAAAA